MDKPGYYATIPASVRYDKTLSNNAKLLYGEITALVNFKGVCTTQNLYFSRLLAISEVGVGKLLRQLADQGYISFGKVGFVRTISIKNGSSSIALFEESVEKSKAPKLDEVAVTKSFILKFNEIRKSKYREIGSVRTALVNRLKTHTEDEILTALKNAMREEFHIEKNFADLTPEFILRENKLEKYLNRPSQETADFQTTKGAQL